MQPVQKRTETKQQEEEAPAVKGQPGQKQKKTPKEKSEADQKLENRWDVGPFINCDVA